ncbi:acetyl-CoA synthetase-like protein [Gymnopilus junonius]|uniref:Acetyl-CoA synthetase-like protein n=1 Tax=Gymnopilus junonius TaxID=109634 RepID=A0A9P5NHQ8_GYMJU|nr:acetyl-CoA synthetase-like protein [Gymnopilus junonius]
MSFHSKGIVHPPLDGTVNIEEAIEFHWKHNADAPFYVFSEDGKDIVTKISYLEFGRACHRVARYVGSRFKSTERRPVIALIALADVAVYQAVCIGIMKAGFIPFPISSRNTPAAVVNFLKKTNCHCLLTTRSTLHELLDGISVKLQIEVSSYQLLVDDIPSLQEIYPKLGHEHEDDPFVPYSSQTARPAITDTAIYIHSSGSTGFPKAIPQTHEILIHWVSFPSGRDYRNYEAPIRIGAMHFPPFHTAGFMGQILFPLYNGCTIALYPPVVDRPDKLPMMPTPENILEHAEKTGVNLIITVPTQIQAWSQDPKAIKFLSSLIHVVLAGGAMAPKVAQSLIASGVKMVTSYGGTEFGSPTTVFKRKEDEDDWDFVEFDHRCKVRWVPQGDGTYECQFLKIETHSLPVENLPDVRGYATSDLFQPHPTKSHLWKIVGRIDDVIIHASGEKTVPAPIEDIVMTSPHLMGTVMFGRAHNQAGVLIEPRESHTIDVKNGEQVAQFRNLIWPVIEEANKVAPAFSRIFKEMILITDAKKPLPRTAKGTVMRKLAVEMYEEEISALYLTVEATEATESIKLPRTWDMGSIVQWLVEQVKEINGKEVELSDDLFEHGFDSLKATILRRRITGALQSLNTLSATTARPNVDQNAVYSYPSIQALSEFLVSILSNESSGSGSKDRIKAMGEMIKKYAYVEHPGPTHFTMATFRIVVVLTGSTGNLGSDILERLLQSPRVIKVYTLNRTPSTPESIAERQLARFRDKGLDTTLLSSDKLVYLEGDFSMERLGLSDPLYTEVQNSVNVIIHNAWRLDFNLSLSSFESNIRGTKILIDLAYSSPHPSNIKFIFTSSIASAASWDRSLGPYPENVVLDPRYAVGNGYGESKYVAERILATSGLNATSLRIGQVSGGRPNGAWATTDWVPILVKSSIALGFLPLTDGVVSWVPMDRVAASILDLVFSEEVYPAAINVLHPKPVPWNTVMEYIIESLEEEEHKTLSLISFVEWVAVLEKVPDERCPIVPALKLLEFFRSLSQNGGRTMPTLSDVHDAEAGGSPQFCLKNIQEYCQSLKEVGPLNKGDVGRWVKYWDQTGLFR